MDDDQELCLCFHVTRRKVVQFIRVNKPTRPSQLSECYGAGTGCGWCRPFLKRLLEETDPDQTDLPDADSYARGSVGHITVNKTSIERILRYSCGRPGPNSSGGNP